WRSSPAAPVVLSLLRPVAPRGGRRSRPTAPAAGGPTRRGWSRRPGGRGRTPRRRDGPGRRRRPPAGEWWRAARAFFGEGATRARFRAVRQRVTVPGGVGRILVPGGARG